MIHHFAMAALNEPARVTAIVSDSDDQQVLFSDWRSQFANGSGHRT